MPAGDECRQRIGRVSRHRWSPPFNGPALARAWARWPAAVDAAAISGAQTAVVPTAMIRPPAHRRAAFTWATRRRASARIRATRQAPAARAASGEETRQLQDEEGDGGTQGLTSLVITSALNGRAALGISTLPGTSAEHGLVTGDGPGLRDVRVADGLAVAGQVREAPGPAAGRLPP